MAMTPSDPRDVGRPDRPVGALDHRLARAASGLRRSPPMSDDNPTFPIPSQPLPLHLLDEDQGDGEAAPDAIETAQMLGELALAQRTRKPQLLPPVEFTIIRELTEADLPILARPGKKEQQGADIVKLHSRHHQIARMIAEGRNRNDIALISGYRPEFISQLQHNPTFNALVAHYSGIGEIAAVDAIERLRALGLEATEILQERLAEATPENFTNGQLMEVVDLAVVRPHVAAMKAAGGVAAAQAAPRQFQVVFRSATARPEDGPMIEGEKTEGRRGARMMWGLWHWALASSPLRRSGSSFSYGGGCRVPNREAGG